MFQTPDVEYCQNNGIICFRPTPTGRLGSLVKLTKSNEPRVWSFGDSTLWTDANGDERIDHIMRGALCGSYQAGNDFQATCHELGLTMQSAGFFVPFSNGRYRNATFNKDGAPTADFPEEELRLMRWDLPTQQQLMELLK